MQIESFQLEEYKGQKFYVQYVGNVQGRYWFQVHMPNGVSHDITIESMGSVEESKTKVIMEFKESLEGRK